MYDFERVKTELQSNPVSFDEDTEDMQLKIEKNEKHYLSRFIEMKKQDKECKQLKKTADSQGKECKQLKKELARLNNLLVIKAYQKRRVLKRHIMKRLSK